MPPDTQLQILDPVVLPITILVMHRLTRQERTPEMLSHDQAMLEHVLLLPNHRSPERVLGRLDAHVATMDDAATLPRPTALSTPSPWPLLRTLP